MTFTIPSVEAIIAFFKWLLMSGFAQLKAVYDASHKWFAIGVAIFVVLIWLGYASLPTFSAKDTALERQVAELTDSVKDLKKSIDSLKAETPAPALKKARK